MNFTLFQRLPPPTAGDGQWLNRRSDWGSWRRWAGILGSLGLAVGQLLAAPPGWVAADFTFETAPTPSCHAGTIVEVKDGLLAAWFGGTAERNPDVGIWVARQTQGKWSAPVEVANGVQHDAKRYACWNPVLFQPRKGPLLLFYKVGPSPKAWWGMLRTSDDDGRTWSPARRLPEDVIGPVKNKPVELANGELLCGASTEEGGWKVHFERTPDLGNTWEITGQVNPEPEKLGAIQPSILFHPGGRLQAVGRTQQERMFEIWSEDNGRTWGKLTLTGMPNPNSGIDAVTLKDGRQLLVYNHTEKGRSPLNVAISADGRVWQAALTLENEKGGEFSYPAVIQAGDGRVHILYTWNRLRIKHVVVDPDRLELRRLKKNGDWPD